MHADSAVGSATDPGNLFICIKITGITMSDVLKVGDAIAKSGEIKKGHIKGIELNNGLSLDVPVLIANGKENGPTLLLSSTEHGTEIQGIWIILEVLNKRLDARKLRGNVIGIPVMNPMAFFVGRYRSWIDHLDYRVRADNPEGNAMETLCHNLWAEAVSKADAWINMHCNVRPDALLFSIIDTTDPRNRDKNIEMARALGYTTIYNTDKPIRDQTPLSYRVMAAKKGTPYVTIEYIDGRNISEPSTSTGVRGILNVMKTLDMIDGEIEPHTEELTIVPGVNKSVGMIRTRRGGLVRFKKNPGEPIKKGDTVAEVYNLFGSLIEKVEMPVDGYIWAFPSGSFDDTSGVLQTVNTGCGLAYAFVHEK